MSKGGLDTQIADLRWIVTGVLPWEVFGINAILSYVPLNLSFEAGTRESNF